VVSSRIRLVFASLVAVPSLASAAGVEALFDFASPQTAPFPSDVFTVPAPANLTGLAIDLPIPDCSLRPSDCADIAVLNTLDGFNVQPRLALRFSDAIDPESVTSTSVFLVKLGDTASDREDDDAGRIVDINQIVIDPQTNTVFAESDELLEQHTRYALIATDELRDTSGDPVVGSALQAFLEGSSEANVQEPELLREALAGAFDVAELDPARVVAASIFTTQSVTAVLENIRDQLRAESPAPATFQLGPNLRRTVFPFAEIMGITFERQTGTQSGPAQGGRFDLIPLPVAGLQATDTIATLAFGSYASPRFLSADRTIPPVATGSGIPIEQGLDPVFFNLFLPRGVTPARGWPVAIFGHGFGGSKNAPLPLIASLAEQGIATIAINVVGHGGGELGMLNVNTMAGDVVPLPAGGRGVDLNGDGAIDATEGFAAAGRIDSRDGLRQTVVDLMQLVQVIRSGGIDVNGDAVAELDPQRIYYTGVSLGGIYGTILLAVDRDIRAGVPNVAGGPLIDVARLSQNFRGLIAAELATRTPTLFNAPMGPPLFGFDENLPLRNEAPVLNATPGAMPLQEFIENSEWATQAGNPVAYAPHVRAEPLAGNAPKPLIFQFARGDQTVPNPTSSALIRAGSFGDRVTLFRNDLFIANLTMQNADPMVLDRLKNPHGFLNVPAGPGAVNALAAQRQIALFFSTDGELLADPDADGPLFETPPPLPLPEDSAFIP
jgi:hypothetical protein